MFRFVLMLCIAVAASSALAAEIVTGRDLVEQCGANGPRCRDFIQGYFKIVLAPGDEGVGPDASNPPGQRRCVRLPDFISYRDLAQILVDYSKNKPELLSEPPEKLADAAYQARFPCPRP